MAFNKVKKAPTPMELNNLKREYRKLSRKYDELKYQFKDHIEWDDLETLCTEDFLELKETYILRKNLYWKIHRLEHPEDTASEKAYRFLNSMTHNDQLDFLREHELTTHGLIEKIKETPDYLEGIV